MDLETLVMDTLMQGITTDGGTAPEEEYMEEESLDQDYLGESDEFDEDDESSTSSDGSSVRIDESRWLKLAGILKD